VLEEEEEVTAHDAKNNPQTGGILGEPLTTLLSSCSVISK
jgi:hypothetical protein